MLLFASDFCGFGLKVLPAAATLTGPSVVHLSDTAREMCGISVVVELPCSALPPLINFLEKVMAEQESLQLVFTVWEKIYFSKESPEMCL